MYKSNPVVCLQKKWGAFWMPGAQVDDDDSFSHEWIRATEGNNNKDVYMCDRRLR
jgi:hypothetical protein